MVLYFQSIFSMLLKTSFFEKMCYFAGTLLANAFIISKVCSALSELQDLLRQSCIILVIKVLNVNIKFLNLIEP